VPNSRTSLEFLILAFAGAAPLTSLAYFGFWELWIDTRFNGPLTNPILSSSRILVGLLGAFALWGIVFSRDRSRFISGPRLACLLGSCVIFVSIILAELANLVVNDSMVTYYFYLPFEPTMAVFLYLLPISVVSWCIYAHYKAT
jgi:hypothetical protein